MYKTTMAILLLAFLQLTGEILDPAGNAVPTASVVLTDVATNATFQTVSDMDGHYVFRDLKPGRYSVVVQAAGFQRAIRPGIMLSTGEKVRLDFMMALGPVEQAVTITSEAPLLRTESADLG